MTGHANHHMRRLGVEPVRLRDAALDLGEHVPRAVFPARPLAKLGRRSRHDRVEFESSGTHDAPGIPGGRLSRHAIGFVPGFRCYNNGNPEQITGPQPHNGAFRAGAAFQRGISSARDGHASSGWGKALLAVLFTAIFARNNTLNRIPGVRFLARFARRTVPAPAACGSAA